MLREAVAAKAALGLEAKRYMDSGALVPDEVVIGLVDERLARSDAASGFVLDGFPRTVAQAEALDAMLRGTGEALDRVVFLDVSREELLRRLTGRRTCRQCGTVFHLVSAPPRDGGPLRQVRRRALPSARTTPSEAVATRLDVYEQADGAAARLLPRAGPARRPWPARAPMDRVAGDIRAAVRRTVPA